jgi:iron complex outermembrane receptor protein
MQKVILGLLLAMYCLSVSSQEKVSLSGRVHDASTGLPVDHATVEIKGMDLQAMTDKKGVFQIGSVAVGNYILVIRHIGYYGVEQPVELFAGMEATLDISLDQKVESLREVVIEDTGLDERIISELPYVETTFSREQIRLEASRDVTDYLRSSKNINGIRKGGTQLDPVVRGFKFSQLSVQVNKGQKIEGGCPNRMDPATAHVEIEDVESIEVLKGPYALRYGPMFGGLINLNTEIPPHTDSSYIHLEALQSYESNWDGNKQHLRVYGGYKWLYYNFSGGRKVFGDYKDGNGNEVKSEFMKYNYKGQLGFTPFSNHSISFNFEESKGRDIRFPTLPMDERKDDTRLLSMDYLGTDISDLVGSIRLKAYQSDVRHEMDNKYRPFSDTVVAVSVIDALNQGARLEAGLNMAGGELIVGADYENIHKDGNRSKYMIMQPGLPVKKEMLWNEAKIDNIGIFTEYTATHNAWEFVAAARIDFNSATSGDIVVQHPMQGEIYHYGHDSITSEFTNVSISLGATWNINKHLALSMAMGRGVRSPDMTERFIILLPIGYDKFDYLGNPRLEPEANNQLDLTLKYTSKRYGLLQLNGFYALLNNYITGERLPPVEQRPLTPDVLGVRQFMNSGNARMRGFELSYATPPQFALGGSLFASYTYGTIDEVPVYVLNEEGEVTGDRMVTHDALSEIPPLEATASVRYRLMHGKLVPRFNLRAVSAQKHVSEAYYEKESEAFMLAGLSVEYNFNRYVRFIAGVNNIFDAAYYEHLNRNIIGSNEDLYEPGRSFYFNLFFTF